MSELRRSDLNAPQVPPFCSLLRQQRPQQTPGDPGRDQNGLGTTRAGIEKEGKVAGQKEEWNKFCSAEQRRPTVNIFASDESQEKKRIKKRKVSVGLTLN